MLDKDGFPEDPVARHAAEVAIEATNPVMSTAKRIGRALASCVIFVAFVAFGFGVYNIVQVRENNICLNKIVQTGNAAETIRDEADKDDRETLRALIVTLNTKGLDTVLVQMALENAQKQFEVNAKNRNAHPIPRFTCKS